MPNIILSGNYGYRSHRLANGDADVIDASRASWTVANTGSPINLYPLQVVDNDPNVRIVGGTINGQVSLSMDWKNAYVNSAAVRVEDTPQATIEDWRISRAWDAIRLNGNSNGFTIDNVWVSDVRDDAVENDNLLSGTIRDSLFDGVFSGISSDGSGGRGDDHARRRADADGQLSLPGQDDAHGAVQGGHRRRQPELPDHRFDLRDRARGPPRHAADGRRLLQDERVEQLFPQPFRPAPPGLLSGPTVRLQISAGRGGARLLGGRPRRLDQAARRRQQPQPEQPEQSRYGGARYQHRRGHRRLADADRNRRRRQPLRPRRPRPPLRQGRQRHALRRRRAGQVRVRHRAERRQRRHDHRLRARQRSDLPRQRRLLQAGLGVDQQPERR